MSGASDEARAVESGGARKGARGNVHFAVAAAILTLSAAGWSLAVEALGWVAVKYAVSWPPGVEVNDEFRMTSLPDRFGPFELVSADGELQFRDGKPHKDGRPDGTGVLSKDTLELLKIGTFTDERNLPERKSNWFTVRTYRDNRRPLRDPLRYWRLEVYYYTGGVDLVPHVPEVCAVAGGAIHLRTEDMLVHVPGAPGTWGKPTHFRRALFQRTGMSGQPTTNFVQYYIFSLNGEPAGSRNVVRLRLASPFVRHAYFAKIQFAPVPVHAIPNPAAADAAATDFARHFLPGVLKTVPMSADMEKLSSR